MRRQALVPSPLGATPMVLLAPAPAPAQDRAQARAPARAQYAAGQAALMHLLGHGSGCQHVVGAWLAPPAGLSFAALPLLPLLLG